jgi:hypothetical protein
VRATPQAISALFATLLCAHAMSQPRLVVPEGTHLDLGKIYRGSVVEKNITLMNAGKDTLVMGTIGVSCGCTGAMVTNDRIPPGGTGSVKITFNSKNFVGPVRKTVTLNSNGDSLGYTTIEFTATVIDEIGLNPQSIILPGAEVNKTSRLTLTVTNNGMTPLSLTGFRTQLKGLVLKLPPAPIPPGGSADIQVEFTPDAPSPMLAEGVFVTTNNIRQPEVYLQIYGGVRQSKER